MKHRLAHGIYKRNESVYLRFKGETGEFKAAERKQRQALTVAGLWTPYEQTIRNEGRDPSRQEVAWRCHLKPVFASLPVSEVTTATITSYIAARRNEGAEGGTINRELTTLQAMFRLGARSTTTGGRPLLDRLPAFPSKLKEGAPRQGFITDTEYALLAANAKPLWLRAFIACAYSFGFRKGELLSLRVGQIDFMDGWIDLRGEDTKSGKPRKVHMSAEVSKLLLACVRGKKPTDAVFTREDGTHIVDPRDDWYDLCVASKLGAYVPAKTKKGADYLKYVGLNIHDFRRSAIRNMTRRNINNTTAMKISGHTTLSTFMRYNIVDETDLIEATRKIEAGREKQRPEKSTITDTGTYGTPELSVSS